MEGVSRLVLVIQCVCILSLGNTLEFTDGENINDALKALQSYVSDLHAKQELLTAEINSVKIELQEQKMLTRQCLQHRAAPDNLVNRKAKHRDLLTNDSTNDTYTQTRSFYLRENMSLKRKIDNAVPSTFHGSTAGRVGFTALANRVSNLGVNQVIHFPNIVTNEGNFYNQQTGVFTCGVAGTYVFYMSIVDSYQSHIRVALVKDDIAIIYIHTPKIPDEYATSSNMALLHLQAGESIWVKTIDTHIDQNVSPWSTFSGFLLYPDFQHI